MIDEIVGVSGIDLILSILFGIGILFYIRDYILGFYRKHYKVVPPEQVHIVVGNLPFFAKPKKSRP